MEFTREKSGPVRRIDRQDASSTSTTRSWPRGRCETQPGKFTLSGDGLCVGYDSGDAVSQEYRTPGTFKGGKIDFAGVTVEKAQYLDLEKEARRVMMAQ